MGAGGLWVTRHLHMFCRRFVHKMQIQLTNFLGTGNKTNGYAGGGGALMELYFVHFFCFCIFVRKFSILYCDYILNIV